MVIDNNNVGGKKLVSIVQSVKRGLQEWCQAYNVGNCRIIYYMSYILVLINKKAAFVGGGFK